MKSAGVFLPALCLCALLFSCASAKGEGEDSASNGLVAGAAAPRALKTFFYGQHFKHYDLGKKFVFKYNKHHDDDEEEDCDDCDDDCHDCDDDERGCFKLYRRVCYFKHNHKECDCKKTHRQLYYIKKHRKSHCH